MKKTVKLLSGLTLAAAFMLVAFSSFSTPDEVVTTTPDAVVVVDCESCPPGWRLSGEHPNNPNVQKYDNNGDNRVCFKRLPENAEGNGNSVRNNGVNIKDNKICD